MTFHVWRRSISDGMNKHRLGLGAVGQNGAYNWEGLILLRNGHYWLAWLVLPSTYLRIEYVAAIYTTSYVVQSTAPIPPLSILLKFML